VSRDPATARLIDLDNDAQQLNQLITTLLLRR